MNRITVLRDILRQKKEPTYLEIGVAYGNVILQMEAKLKIGVEPYPPPDFWNSLAIQRNGGDPSLKFYKQSSDVFFRRTAKHILKEGADVVFVDGLHNYSQALADVENSLVHLKNDGIIVMHDCNPLSFATSFPIKKSFSEILRLAKKGEIPGWNGCWNGDVWKALVHLRITRPELEVFTLDLDWGLGIITKNRAGAKRIRPTSLQKLQHATYSWLEHDREQLLNLKHPKYLKEFLSKRQRL